LIMQSLTGLAQAQSGGGRLHSAKTREGLFRFSDSGQVCFGAWMPAESHALKKGNFSGILRV
jgi:hypothetical protein